VRWYTFTIGFADKTLPCTTMATIAIHRCSQTQHAIYDEPSNSSQIAAAIRTAVPEHVRDMHSRFGAKWHHSAVGDRVVVVRNNGTSRSNLIGIHVGFSWAKRDG
jgi:DUF917 family protein